MNRIRRFEHVKNKHNRRQAGSEWRDENSEDKDQEMRHIYTTNVGVWFRFSPCCNRWGVWMAGDGN
jgi:hypothetical protein